jgi:peptidoglycan/xylan/chitin deacetylase (PgdA/CDA1 family)
MIAIRRWIKEAIFFLYLYSGYVQLRDLLLALMGRSRAVVFYYHRIGGCDALTKPVRAFRQELEYIKRRYECISLGELARRLRENEPMRRRAAVITFDDGYRDNLTEAVPALREAGLTATFFVSTGFVGTDREFPHDALGPGGPHPKLTWDDLRGMEAEGFEIGSHTINHVSLGRADAETLEREIFGSLEALNRELGHKPRAFSFPWGKPEDISERALQTVKRAGYYAAASAFGGTNRCGSDPMRIRRIDVGNGNLSKLAVRARMAGFDPDYLRARLRMRKARIRQIFCGAAILMAFCGLAKAKTIYVSPGGRDDNPGTFNKPVASPACALELADPGDVIALRSGRYELSRSLWVDKPTVKICSQPGERAAIIAGIGENSPPSVIIIVADQVTIEDLEIVGGSYYGIKIEVDRNSSTRDVTIRRCYIHHTGRDSIKAFNADRLLIEDCQIGPSGARDPSNAEGIDVIGSIGVTIRRSKVIGAATNGIYLKGGTRDGLIESCWIERVGHSGILLGQDTDLEYMRNGAKHEAINCAARNNIVIGAGAAGLGTYSGLNVRFENNTLYDVAQKMQAGFWVVTNTRGVPSERVSFKNNIVVILSGRPMIFVLDLTDQLACDSNIYYSAKNKYEFRREAAARGQFWSWSFPQWQANMRADGKSRIADPLLEPYSYRPLPGSPAIDRGEQVPEVRFDYSGVARPQGAAFDIGAHEVAARR